MDPNTIGTAAVVIVAPYEAMCAGDRISFTFAPTSGSQVWSRTVVVDRVDIGKILKWNLPRAEFLKIEGETANAFYKIEYASGGESTSASQLIEVAPLATEQLRPPVLQGHDGGFLDPGHFPQGVSLQIDPYPTMALGDDVLLHWVSSHEASSTTSVLRVDPSIIDSNMLAFSIGKEWLEANIGRQVTVSWQYARIGTAQNSEPFTLTIRTPVDLTPPVVEKANSYGELQANDALRGVYATIPEAIPLDPGDSVELHWQGHLAGGRYIATQPLDPANPRRFFIPPSAVAANIGGETKRFPVFYKLKLASGILPDSDPFHLLILPLQPNQYPAVRCRQAEGSPGLSLGDVPEEGADIYVTRWPFMAPGQPCTIHVTGVLGDGAGADLILRDAIPVTQLEMEGGELSTLLPREFLKTLKTGSTLSLWGKITYDGNTLIDLKRSSTTWFV
ncbi:hypothetical protein GA830_01695 [Mesorhizobium sp. NBSH29]|uniref:hypothetical protein n=1 Tax=Mesorhizobium sp. NBSH29 TaxID=2654249 RepID=UPI001896660D|nr:hypothetical protein [Mesorhizobium sp. NBSH29]QPC85594.1 hypothetical protein GA830_01695 [Mesorhizobium sp. NBSH29]